MSARPDGEEPGDFISALAHDLRAPLRAIDGFARIVEEDEGGRLSEEGRKSMEIIRANAARMGELIERLLAYARLASAEVELLEVDMESFALGAYREAVPPEGRARIEFDLARLPVAAGDPRLLKQAWANLISNAVKFSSKRERARIEIRGERLGDELVYTVRDDGVGFDMRYRDKLFGAFQWLHSAREFDGSGLGLAIVRRAVALQGGRVLAEGEPGRGAVFGFALPAAGAGT